MEDAQSFCVQRRPLPQSCTSLRRGLRECRLTEVSLVEHEYDLMGQRSGRPGMNDVIRSIGSSGDRVGEIIVQLE